ncbi:MAG: F0F1 ATP synthase subunit B [Candidatus Parcubacteria bacterium]|nr:F0F1 ATP synthase subunit B [Candidatus Parcubacteria bacterium]
MESLISTFHLDLKLIIAQLVNFLIVAGILWFFALKPIMKIMKERTEKIEKGLKDAKSFEEKLAQAERDRLKTLSVAKKEAEILLEKASQEADANKKQMMSQAKGEIEKLVVGGKTQLASEKEKMVSEVKAEIGDLVVEATKKVLNTELDKKIDNKIIKEAIKEIK